MTLQLFLRLDGSKVYFVSMIIIIMITIYKAVHELTLNDDAQ